MNTAVLRTARIYASVYHSFAEADRTFKKEPDAIVPIFWGNFFVCRSINGFKLSFGIMNKVILYSDSKFRFKIQIQNSDPERLIKHDYDLYGISFPVMHAGMKSLIGYISLTRKDFY